MKKALILSLSSVLSFAAFAQSASKATPGKKVETIKIIDGDTVMHKIKVIDDDHAEKHYKKAHKDFEIHGEEFEVLNSHLEDVDVYIEMDDAHKHMMVKRMSRHQYNIDSLINSLGDHEDLIIDMDKKNHQIRVIKMEIEESDGEEVTVIEIRKEKGQKRPNDSQGHPSYKKRDSRIKAFPNPSHDTFKLNMYVSEENTVVTVKGQNGKTLFEKTYMEIGDYSEEVALKGAKKGFVVVTLRSASTEIQKKLIVE